MTALEDVRGHGKPLRLPRRAHHVTRDGLWVIGEPVSGAGHLLRPLKDADLRWWADQKYHNHYRTLADIWDFLDDTFYEGAHPEPQALSSLIIP